ncbi:hypothetical protein ABPG72_009034 [Tetrahymena utriculariae]
MDNRDDLDPNDLEEEENEEEVKNKGNDKLIAYASKGMFAELKKLLEKKQYKNINHEDKKKWTPIIWAACKGHTDIVRLLIQYDAHKQYVEDTLHDKRATLGVINTSIKQTPLQWASYKGFLNIVWILLKNGLNWDDIDAFGNNCVHLAASGGNLQVFQCFMMLGVEVTGKNSRGHEVLDLATNQEIISLTKSHKLALRCAATNEVFNDSIKRHWCSTCRKFFCDKYYRVEWTWENHNSSIQERMDGKCLKCWENIAHHSEQLKEKMKEYEQKGLTEKLNEIEQYSIQQQQNVLIIEIDLKLLNEAKIIQERLKTQNHIKEFIASLKIVKDYKTIRKSANRIRELREDAEKRGVQLDADVLELMQNQIDRLESERDLRYEFDNLDIGNCNPEQVQKLEKLIEIAQKNGVASNYTDEAVVLKEKMARSIRVKDIYKKFTDYPVRAEYIEPLYIDFKTKKPFDPITKKPADLKVYAAPPKKKKKKEPKFIIPDWATVLKDMNSTIQEVEELLKSQEELQLEKEFVDQCNEQIVRMKRELKWRKGMEVQDQIIAEYKAAQKKKK